MSMIDQERKGGNINQALLKDVLDIYVEMGMDSMKYYEDFEVDMLKATAEYYSTKASQWIAINSYNDYMLKVDECLKQETNRASCYLHSSSKQKLLKVVEQELSMYAGELQENALTKDVLEMGKAYTNLEVGALKRENDKTT
ncbi:PREDICTED: putative cullin-like protein 2 [Nelumbo nucifera]|nr:PREDICTED: putative cullin-like protein 2 [Nelumbo nucifera]